jgi:glycosyltransferase involved in cell wall biosynthesis
MRIAMVSEHASPLAILGGEDAGGQNVHVAALATELARLGADVDVFTRRDDAGLPAEVELVPGVRVVHVDAGPPRPVSKDALLPHMPRFADVLEATWSRERPDVVHSHFWMSGIASLEAAAGLDIPVVHTFHALGVVKRRHQGAADPSPPQRLGAERRILRAAEHIVATCSDEVFELVREGADPHRITVVPCGVDLRRFSPSGPLAPRGSRPRIVVVSRLVARKGIGNVVEALAEVPEAELVIGGGPASAELPTDVQARRLRELAERFGVGPRVRLLGRMDRARVPRLIRSADVVACVPWYEPFGIVPLEAMACGVPVVASSVGGLIDTVVDGVTGLHVPPRDPPRIAEALRRLLADDALRRRLGDAGARRANARYSWERVARATLRVYRRVLSDSAQRRIGVAP